MKRRAPRAALGILALMVGLVLPAMAQDTRPGIAVLPFANGGSYGQDKENFAALERGIPATLITELSLNPALRLVERTETQRLLDEQGLAESGRVDAATAAKIGSLVGARYIITGTFIDYYGKFRVDARIVDVATSEILTVVKAGPKDRQALYELLRDLARDIQQQAGLPPLPTAVSNAGERRAIPTGALTSYSRALLYHDHGHTTKAVEFYQRAIEAFPDYTEAKEGLRKIRP
jgi:TolB-like protein